MNEQSVVLLVDDEPNVTSALARALKSEPYRIATTSSAEAGLEYLEAHRVDVVVSDEKMPGTSGSAFLAEVRRRWPHTIRMILSGQADLDAAVRAINEGEIYRFFLKPCNPSDLKVTIRQALESKRLAALSRRLLREHRRQASFVQALEREHPGLTELHVDDDGAILINDSDAGLDVSELVEQLEQCLESACND